VKTLETRIEALEHRTGGPFAAVVNVLPGEDKHAAIARARATWTHEPTFILVIKGAHDARA
jgi:hypothetical protein